MDLNVRTFVIILGITHLIQVLVFYHQYRINKTYQGIGWWLMWSAAEAVAFLVMPLRSITEYTPIAIFIQNCMLVSGVVFIFIGTRKFLDQPVNWKITIPLILMFFIGSTYHTFINDDINIRSAVLNVTLGLFGFLTAYSLLTSKIKTIRASLLFNAVIFLVHGGLFLYRTIMILMGVQIPDFFSNSLFNLIPLLDALIVSLLWTFGFIIMVNQRLNSEMSEAKEQAHMIFNTSPDAAVITRLTDGLIIDMNDGYCSLTGYTKEEIHGKTTIGVNLWKNSADRKAVVEKLKAQGFCENYEAVFIRKDGTELTGLISAKIINIQNNPHIISITRDISERKRGQDAVAKHNQELKKLNEEKDRFLSILAHDLRSPFHAFLGFTEYLTEELPGLTLKEVANVIERMRASAISVFQLLENLLQWGRMQQGTLPFEPAMVPFQQVVEDTMSALSVLAKKKNIEVTFAFQEDLQIFGDKNLINTLIRNLFSNALKFTPKGGKINISARSDNTYVEIIVSDTGIGMSEDLVANLFSPDGKTNRAGTEGESSSGLGLLICKESVDKHHGKIWVVSEVGKGSAFHVRLPNNI